MIPQALTSAAAPVEALLEKHGVKLTLGGEPTYVPLQPEGAEWSITALGPTKLRYAYAMAAALVEQRLPGALTIFSPGKHYPGEVNPRWSINLLWRKDGAPVARLPSASGNRVTSAMVKAIRGVLGRELKIAPRWVRARDPLAPKRVAWVLPLDHDGRKFVAEDWKLGPELELLASEGPAGLRLPLQSVPETASRRALTLEVEDGRLNLFLPPFLQKAWLKLLRAIGVALREAGCGAPGLSGYVPGDEADSWVKLAVTADPGVLEINLPPCATWLEYARWMEALESAATATGLRSFKQFAPGEEGGTGGGNHLLFGGPTLAENPLFTQPQWLISILRYWQRHPSLAYLFTGSYVGSASQAPRPDESASALYDLEMAYQFLQQLPAGTDHRQLIGETLRHLHTDASGNTHRSEISFDKFWNSAFDGGCRGLMEFRAVESLPKAEWMSAVALLWRAIAAMTLERPDTTTLIDHGPRLHDDFFLPSQLWADLREILRDLKRAGLPLPEGIFREIYEWRFPLMLEHGTRGARLTVRKALEAWPLLCEQPLQGGSTSRFVDTSIERLELSAEGGVWKESRVFVQGRELKLEPAADGRRGAGLRYRRTALYPSLHPGIRPHMPLVITITDRRRRAVAAFRLEEGARLFSACEAEPLAAGLEPCKKLNAGLRTCDLRIA
jgi:uncharacterized protein (DUF2126 family)